MLHYRIEIQGNAKGEVFYSVLFQSAESNHEEKKFSSAETVYINSTVEQLTEALKALSRPPEERAL